MLEIDGMRLHVYFEGRWRGYGDSDEIKGMSEQILAVLIGLVQGQMTNPQYTLTIALGVGPEGEARRKLYEKCAGNKPLSQWVREALDKAAERELRKQLYGLVTAFQGRGLADSPSRIQAVAGNRLAVINLSLMPDYPQKIVTVVDGRK